VGRSLKHQCSTDRIFQRPEKLKTAQNHHLGRDFIDARDYEYRRRSTVSKDKNNYYYLSCGDSHAFGKNLEKFHSNQLTNETKVTRKYLNYGKRNGLCI